MKDNIVTIAQLEATLKRVTKDGISYKDVGILLTEVVAKLKEMEETYNSHDHEVQDVNRPDSTITTSDPSSQVG